MASYKAIIGKMVEMEVTLMVEKASGKFAEIVEGSFKMTAGGKDTEPMWHVEVQILGETGKDYRFAGYVDDYGNVVTCSVSYNRTYCDMDGNNRRTVSNFLVGKQIDAFKFNC